MSGNRNASANTKVPMNVDPYGWVNQIIRVNLTEGSIKVEKLNSQDAKLYLGARGIGTKLLIDEVNPKAMPLSPENKLIFMTGPLTGTLAPCPSRYEIVSKAPLTGVIGVSNLGGYFGPELKYAGYDGIIFEGRAEKPVYLYIKDGSVELRSAEHLWGKEISPATAELLRETEADSKVACIGPAGEKLVLFATIVNENNRADSRSGLGAVMGSKNLKAVVVKGTRPVKVAVPEEFRVASFRARKKLNLNPFTGQRLTMDGTQAIADQLNKSGIYPIRCFDGAGKPEQEESMEGIAAQRSYVVRKNGCFGCSIGCGSLVDIAEGELKGYGEGPDYLGSWAFGMECGVKEPKAVIKANLICNELGMDPVTMGATIACAMRLSKMGSLSQKELGIERELVFGNAETVLELIRMTAYREGFGDRMAEGSFRMAEAYEHPELSLSVKKLEMPVYDGREMQGIGLEYATSNDGGCRASSSMTTAEILGIRKKREPLKIEDKVNWIKTFQDFSTVIQASGICVFSALAIGLPELAVLLSAATGIRYTSEEVLQIGERIWNLEKTFNLKAGFTKAEDLLPSGLLGGVQSEERTKGKANESDNILPKYYQARGWNSESIPAKEKLKELSING